MKLAALASASAVVSNGTATCSEKCTGAEDTHANQDLTWQKAPCRFCGTGCHVQVGVGDGKVQAVAGDPLADVNKAIEVMHEGKSIRTVLRM